MSEETQKAMIDKTMELYLRDRLKRCEAALRDSTELLRKASRERYIRQAPIAKQIAVNEAAMGGDV